MRSVGRIRSGVIRRVGLASHIWIQILRGYEPYCWSFLLGEFLADRPGIADHSSLGVYWPAPERAGPPSPVAVSSSTGIYCF